MRRKARTAFTLLSVSVAFVLFCVLGAVRVAFSSGLEGAGADRVVVTSRYSLVRLLPLPHTDDIRGVDGVVDLSHQTWFGGIYQDPSNFFAQFAVDAESYLRIYPEIVLDPAERDAFLANRAGAIVGRSGSGVVAVGAGDPTGGYLPLFALPPGTLPFGAVLVLAIGLLAGVLPCVAAMRLRIVDGLRRSLRSCASSSSSARSSAS